MDIKSLRLFLSLANTLHFAKSSQQMHVSPSTLSRSIARLEEQLGVLLFERDNRTVNLTKEGQRARETIETMVRAWQQLQTDLQQSGRVLQGKINLYCSVTASYSLLLPWLQKFRPLYPQIDVVVETGDAAYAIDKVHQDQADIVIAPKPDRLPPGLEFHTFTRSPLVLIRPEIECAVSTQAQDGASAWNEIPFIMPERGVIRQRVSAWFQAQHTSPNVYAQVSSHEATISMVALGFGVGVVPELALQTSPMREQVAVVPVATAIQDFEIGLCCLRRRLQNPLLQAFWQLSETPVTE